MYYHEPTIPRYARPMGSALGKYNRIGAPHDGYPVRAGICYRDLSDIDVEYDCNGSRSDVYVGQYKETEGSTLIRGRNNDEMLAVGIANITIHKTGGTKAVGSRMDFFGGKDDEKILRFIYAIMSELGSRSVGKYAGIARDSCTMAYGTDDRFGSRGWTITTKYQM